MKKYTILFVLVCLAFLVSGQMPAGSLSWRNNLAYNAYLMRIVHQQYAVRQVELEKAVQSKKQMLLYRDQLRERYRTILGDLPEKTPLNGKVLGTSQHKGFQVEKILFESLPKRYVTANLYLPDGKGPFPASLELCGHGIGGKLGSAEAVLMALNGIAVLVVDPIGQGERVQLLDQDGKPAVRGATTEHTLLNAGCNLLGSSLAAYEYWDNLRAVDYIETRAEIDKNRLAAYGSSGGGTQTAYLIAMEPRLKVACICSYFSQRERVLELSGASDGCQHIPGEGSNGIEIADFVTMFAPKPVLIMSGLYDFVDFQGAVHGFNELQSQYEVLGARDAVKQFVAQSGHGMPKAKREALATWFRTWLCNDPAPVRETEIERVALDDMQCTATGQVNTSLPDALSVPQANLEMALQMAVARDKFIHQNDDIIRQKLLELLGIKIPTSKVVAEQTGYSHGRTYDLYRYQIIRQDEMPIPCVVVLPEVLSPTCKIVLDINDSGKESLLNDESTLSNHVNQGDIVIIADLRGYGETADPASLNESKYWNREYRNAMISLHIGESVVGQRVKDILTLVDFISSDPRFAIYTIRLEAAGSYGPAAIHATFLEKRIFSTEISRSVRSYLDFIREPLQLDMYTNVIPGVLRYYDLSDLAAKAGVGRIVFTD